MGQLARPMPGCWDWLGVMPTERKNGKHWVSPSFLSRRRYKPWQWRNLKIIKYECMKLKTLRLSSFFLSMFLTNMHLPSNEWVSAIPSVPFHSFASSVLSILSFQFLHPFFYLLFCFLQSHKPLFPLFLAFCPYPSRSGFKAYFLNQIGDQENK